MEQDPEELSSAPLGLFGGRFDPVHCGHIKIAQAVANQLHLPEIRWIVTGDPVHKSAVATAKDRLAMVKIALNELNDSRMKIDECEILAAAKTGRPNYTAETIMSIKKDFPNRILIWVLGEDQLQNFHTWFRWEWLVQNVEIAICSRQNTKSKSTADRIKSLGGVLHWIRFTPCDVSSTQIRQDIRNSRLSDNQLPKGVFEYIRRNKLYR